MKLAVMQPYIFPYIGYFHLLHAVDTFVFFDDVQYKRRSYISRNAVLANGRAWSFSVPTKKASRDSLIKDVMLHPIEFESWRDKFLKTLEHSYSKAPHFESVMTLITSILKLNQPGISDLARASIKEVAAHLEIDVRYKQSKNLGYNRSGNGQDKILSICNTLGASQYINAINGKSLYNSEVYKKQTIDLTFVNSNITSYDQSGPGFVSHLSIIDMMMHLDKEELHKHLRNYTLIN